MYIKLLVNKTSEIYVQKFCFCCQFCYLFLKCLILLQFTIVGQPGSVVPMSIDYMKQKVA